MASVELHHAQKTYPNGFVAVRDFSLTIADKEFLVMVGPSGCGKSTTLRMIAGLESLSAGDIVIDGKVVNDLPPKDRDIAMVFQNYALYPHMSVYENMAFGLKLRKCPRAEIKARVQEAAETLGLQDLLKRLPKQLSGGQRQRVALGRAIVRKPKVFLFDEPLSNLDAKMRVEMRDEIHRLHRRLQATIIYVTHDQIEAMTMGDRIVVMDRGEVCQIATPLTLYNEPANLFCAGFIGTPPMNFLKMKPTADGLMSEAGVLPLLPAWRDLIPVTASEVVFGIRPENLIQSFAQEKHPGALKATLELLEPMGAETYAHFRIAEAHMIARVAPDCSIREGTSLYIMPDLVHAHLFDTISGLRLV